MRLEAPVPSLAGADPRLLAWVARIWHSHGVGDGPVAVTLGPPPPGHVVVEQYAVLPHPRAVRFLVPMGSRPVSVAVFRRYRRTRGPASRSVRTVLAGGFAAGLADHLFRHRLVVSVDRRFPRARRGEVLFLAHLAERLGRSDLWAFTAVRQINPNAKPTLELFDRDGIAVGYAKLGTTAATRELVRTEASALSAVQARLDDVVVPQVLAAGDWGQGAYAVTSPLPDDLRRWTRGPGSTVAELASIARSAPASHGPLAGSTYAGRLRADIAAARSADMSPDPLPAGVPAVLLDWLERLERQPTSLEFGRLHGDWIPDNLGSSGGRLVAWDWEHSNADAPVGFDLLHWHFHRVFVRAGLAAAVAELDEVAPLLAALDVPVPAHRLVCSLYLLDVFVRRLKLAVGGGGWNDRWYPGVLDVAAGRDLT